MFQTDAIHTPRTSESGSRSPTSGAQGSPAAKGVGEVLTFAAQEVSATARSTAATVAAKSLFFISDSILYKCILLFADCFSTLFYHKMPSRVKRRRNMSPRRAFFS